MLSLNFPTSHHLLTGLRVSEFERRACAFGRAKAELTEIILSNESGRLVVIRERPSLEIDKKAALLLRSPGGSGKKFATIGEI